MPNNPNAVDNLIPAKKGEVRNPKGKPKGTKHISTWIQEMLNDEEFETNILDAKKGMIEYKGAPLKAIIGVAMNRAINDPKGGQQWAEWLAKHGYGNRTIVEVSDPLDKILGKFNIEGEDEQSTDRG
jgi:hypothetical protein